MVPSRSASGGGNHTSVAMFVLLGLLDQAELQLILFLVFLGTYLMTLVWNLGLIILIRVDSHLHTPMYFFLSFLSFIDICYSSSISPRMLSDFLKAEKTISFLACVTQSFAFSWTGLSECCLLAAMAYDRYVAIGSPLQYSAIMAPSVCWRIVAAVCGSGFLSSFFQTGACFNLDYCGPNVIPHFFCSTPQILSLSCSDPFLCQLIISLEVVFVAFGSLLVILLSYVFIVVSILKVASFKGCVKAFKTCGSHLATVTLFYGTGFSVYRHHNSQQSTKQDKVPSVVYAILIPMVNPLIYSLRNTEIKGALTRVMKKIARLPQKE